MYIHAWIVNSVNTLIVCSGIFLTSLTTPYSPEFGLLLQHRKGPRYGLHSEKKTEGPQFFIFSPSQKISYINKSPWLLFQNLIHQWVFHEKVKQSHVKINNLVNISFPKNTFELMDFLLSVKCPYLLHDYLDHLSMDQWGGRFRRFHYIGLLNLSRFELRK